MMLNDKYTQDIMWKYLNNLKCWEKRKRNKDYRKDIYLT